MTARIWLVLLALTACLPHTAQAQEPCGRRTAARRVLDETRVTARFERFTLDDCVTFLHDTAGLEVAVSPRARAAAKDHRVSLRVRAVTVRSVVELIVGQLARAELRWRLHRGVVLVGEVNELRAPVRTAFYDVGDLDDRPDFPAPEAGLFVPDPAPAPRLFPEVEACPPCCACGRGEG